MLNSGLLSVQAVTVHGLACAAHPQIAHRLRHIALTRFLASQRRAGTRFAIDQEAARLAVDASDDGTLTLFLAAPEARKDDARNAPEARFRYSYAAVVAAGQPSDLAAIAKALADAG